MMKKPKLIDMFGLSGDPANDKQLDDLLFRLESDVQTSEHSITILFQMGQLGAMFEGPEGITVLF